MVFGANSAEHWQVAPLGQMAADQGPEEVGPDMRDEREQDEHVLGRGEFAAVVQAGELRQVEPMVVEWTHRLARRVQMLAESIPNHRLGCG
jgi:hypothetical protein